MALHSLLYVYEECMNVLLLLYTYIDGNIGGNKHVHRESFIPGGVTHTLGRNDRGVIHSSDTVSTSESK